MQTFFYVFFFFNLVIPYPPIVCVSAITEKHACILFFVIIPNAVDKNDSYTLVSHSVHTPTAREINENVQRLIQPLYQCLISRNG